MTGDKVKNWRNILLLVAGIAGFREVGLFIDFEVIQDTCIVINLHIKVALGLRFINLVNILW